MRRGPSFPGAHPAGLRSASLPAGAPRRGGKEAAPRPRTARGEPSHGANRHPPAGGGRGQAGPRRLPARPSPPPAQSEAPQPPGRGPQRRLPQPGRRRWARGRGPGEGREEARAERRGGSRGTAAPPLTWQPFLWWKPTTTMCSTGPRFSMEQPGDGRAGGCRRARLSLRPPGSGGDAAPAACASAPRGPGGRARLSAPPSARPPWRGSRNSGLAGVGRVARLQVVQVSGSPERALGVVGVVPVLFSEVSC